MLNLTHADPALHTADAYRATATRIAQSDPPGASLFREMAEAQDVMDNPVVSFASTTHARSFAIKDYAATGVLIGADGKTTSIFDEALRAAVEAAGENEKTRQATGIIGNVDTFASIARAFQPGTLEHDQAVVFAERMDERLRTGPDQPTHAQSSHRDLILDAVATGRDIRTDTLEGVYPVGAGPDTSSGLFQADYAGRDNAVFVVRGDPADVVLRQTGPNYEIQVDEGGSRQVIEVEGAKNAAALMSVSLEVLAQDRRFMFAEDDIAQLADQVTAKMKASGWLPPDFNVKEHIEAKRKESGAGPADFERHLGVDSKGRNVAVWAGESAGPDGPAPKNGEPVHRHYLTELGLPAQLERGYGQGKTTEQMKEEMVGLIRDATSAGTSTPKPGWSYQIQASHTELSAVVESLKSGEAPPPLVTASLHSPATVSAVILLKDAVSQPEFVKGPAKGFKMDEARHEGPAGIDHLRRSFGPGRADDLVADRVPQLEMLDPAYRQFTSKPTKQFVNIAGRVSDRAPERLDEVKSLARKVATMQVLQFDRSGITNATPTRAVHIDPVKAIAIIEALPPTEVGKAYNALRDANRNNISRLGDRQRLKEVTARAAKDVAQQFGVSQKSAVGAEL